MQIYLFILMWRPPPSWICFEVRCGPHKLPWWCEVPPFRIWRKCVI